jgi:DNA end-binding protein Ku
MRGRRAAGGTTRVFSRQSNGQRYALRSRASPRRARDVEVLPMARSMWKGAIQFGLVTIPVKMYLATESKGVSFNMLHASCHSRIQMKTYCPVDDEYIGRSDTVRGYDIGGDQYVVVTDEDLASVPLKTVRSIQIEQFVPVDEAADATRFIKQSYYLEPDPVARKAFYLLKQILGEKGLRAIGKIVLRDREQLVALDPFASTMLLSTMYWPDEIRNAGELALPENEVEVKPAERAMAEQLVMAMTGEFDATAYHDEYREALLEIIEAKAEGQQIEAPAPAPTTGVADLMAALEASVAAAKAARSTGAPEPEPAAARGSGRKPVAVGPGRGRAAAAGNGAAAEEAEEREAVPARRRKSA